MRVLNRKKRLKGSWAYVLFVILVLSLTACEHVPQASFTDAVVEVADEASPDAELALLHQAQALKARDMGEHGECATSFAEAARLTSSTQESGLRWYEASRCAARAGDYRQSTFHLNAAASKGFTGLALIKSEPLFRPLHSGKRWLLLLDQVTANQASNPQVWAPLEHDGPVGIPCAVLKSLRDQFLLRS